ncbi:MAG TPA: hypothetical protein VFM37_00910 [Pseudonocardiaceae bacterium]|nr:hypothetical protein [Pseudonocardiaceae bacterium]
MTRTSVLAAGVLAASVTVAFAGGCSAGQVTQTDQQVAAVPGVSTDLAVAGGRVSVRNVLLPYPGAQGYPQGSSAPVEVAIFNDTRRPLRVRVSSPDAAQVVLSAPTPSPAGPATASPSATASPRATASPSATASPGAAATSSPAGGAAELEIPAGGYTVFTSGSPRQLRLVGLATARKPGQSVRLRFEFTGGAAVEVSAGIAPPFTPAPRSPMIFEETHGAGPGHG